MTADRAADLALVARPPVPAEQLAQPLTPRLPEPPVPVRWGPDHEDHA